MKYQLPAILCYILPVPISSKSVSLGWPTSLKHHRYYKASNPFCSKIFQGSKGGRWVLHIHTNTPLDHPGFTSHHPPDIHDTSNVSRNKAPCPVRWLWHVVPWHAMLQCLCVHGPSACCLDHWGELSLDKTTN